MFHVAFVIPVYLYSVFDVHYMLIVLVEFFLIILQDFFLSQSWHYRGKNVVYSMWLVRRWKTATMFNHAFMFWYHLIWTRSTFHEIAPSFALACSFYHLNEISVQSQMKGKTYSYYIRKQTQQKQQKRVCQPNTSGASTSYT